MPKKSSLVIQSEVLSGGKHLKLILAGLGEVLYSTYNCWYNKISKHELYIYRGYNYAVILLYDMAGIVPFLL